MSPRVLKHLNAILETGSIAAAAKKLYVSQPSLSQYVRRIEEDYSIDIFDRTTLPWKLTEEGRYFIETQREIDLIEKRRRQYFSDRNALLQGKLTIGTTQYRTNALLGPVLSEFRRKYPQISLRLVENRSKELVSLVESGEADCAFVVDVFIPKDQLNSVTVFSEEVLLCVPKTHPLSLKYPIPQDNTHYVIDFKEVLNEPFIVLNPGQAMRLYFDKLCEMYNCTPSIALESQSISTVQPMVSAGLGIALVPSPLAKNSDNLRYFSFGTLLPPNPLSIISSKKRYLSKAARAFITMVTEILSKQNQKTIS